MEATFDDDSKVEGWFKDDNENHKSIKTHQMPTPRVTHADGVPQPTIPLLKDFNGRLMNIWTVDLGASSAPAGYEFAIEAPSNTGLQVVTGSAGKCSWTTTTPTQSGWQKASDDFYLARCGLGEKANLTIKAKVDHGGNLYDFGTYGSVTTSLSWHQYDNHVYYVFGTIPPTTTPTPTPTPAPVGTATPTPTPTPTGTVTPTPAPIPDFETVIIEAADKWNSPGTGATFCKNVPCGDDGKRIDIHVVTPVPTTTATNPQSREPCGDISAPACVQEGLTYGDEHIGNRKMYIVHPPHIYERVGKAFQYGEFRWTDIQSVASRDPDYLYLPSAALHEWGHAAGVGHSPDAWDVMYGENESQYYLQTNDKEAMKAIYGAHSH